MIRVFVDTSVLLHAFGAEHPLREGARRLLARIEHDLVVHAGAETIQEFVFHRMRVSTRESAISMGRDLIESVTIHPFDEKVARRAVDLMASSSIGGRDAVLAATALEAGFEAIVTDDSRFVSAGGLRVTSVDEFLRENPAD